MERIRGDGDKAVLNESYTIKVSELEFEPGSFVLRFESSRTF
jgi:hypothetical protein